MLRMPPCDRLPRVILNLKRGLPLRVHSDGVGRKDSIRPAVGGLEEGETADVSLNSKDFKANSHRAQIDAQFGRFPPGREGGEHPDDKRGSV